MKVKVNKSKPKFTPFELVIKIETREELDDLFCRINIHAYVINDSTSSYYGSRHLEADDESSKFLLDKLFDIITYSELGQKLFDSYYDAYITIIENLEVKPKREGRV